MWDMQSYNYWNLQCEPESEARGSTSLYGQDLVTQFPLECSSLQHLQEKKGDDSGLWG